MRLTRQVLAGIVFACGGGPASGQYAERVGGRYWSDPGAFANGFKGVCSVFVTAAFSVRLRPARRH